MDVQVENHKEKKVEFFSTNFVNVVLLRSTVKAHIHRVEEGHYFERRQSLTNVHKLLF